MATIGQGFAMQQLIEKKRQGDLRGHVFDKGNTFGGAGYDGFNYAGGSPSMNIPTAPSAQSTMAGIGQRALEDTSVSDAIARGGNQAALGYAETLEDAQRQAIRREMAREQQNRDRFGGGVISGSTSAGKDEDARNLRRLQGDFQSQQEKYALADAQMRHRMELEVARLEAQGATLDIQRELQLELRALQMEDKRLDREFTRAQNELNRQHQKDIDSAQGGRQMQIANMNNAMSGRQLDQDYRKHKERIKHDIEKTEFAAQQNTMPSFSVTASTVSPGGAGRSGMNPASRHAWS